jgi:hypothetical protein
MYIRRCTVLILNIVLWLTYAVRDWIDLICLLFSISSRSQKSAVRTNKPTWHTCSRCKYVIYLHTYLLRYSIKLRDMRAIRKTQHCVVECACSLKPSPTLSLFISPVVISSLCVRAQQNCVLHASVKFNGSGGRGCEKSRREKENEREKKPRQRETGYWKRFEPLKRAHLFECIHNI